MHKVMDIVRVGDQPANDEASDVVLHEIAPALLRDDALVGLQIDVARPGTRARFSRELWPHLKAVHAIISRVYADATNHVVPVSDPTITARSDVHAPWSFVVVQHVGIERSRSWPDGTPSPGLKHVSLLCPTVDKTNFRLAYRHHVELVIEHLPLMWQYVQNDVEQATGHRGNRFAAISELSYQSEADYERRWKLGAESEIEFRAHEGFLDLPMTVTLLCTEHIMRSTRDKHHADGESDAG